MGNQWQPRRLRSIAHPAIGWPGNDRPSDGLFALIADHDVAAIAAALAEGSDANGIQYRSPGSRPLHAAIEELENGARST
ncbi:hypothetical protein [Nocardia gipuzkoensis]